MLAAILNMAVKTNFHGEAAGCLSAARIAYKVCVVGRGGGGGDAYSGFQVTGMIVWEQKNPLGFQ